MALDSYTALKASAADWLQRTDLTAAIPDFIAMAEAQIGRRLLKDGPVRRMMVRSDATISTEFAAVPSDFVGAKTIYLVEGNYTRQLQFCLPEQINEKKSNTTQLTGCPLFFSVVGGEFQFFPAPVESYSAELTYWSRITPLSASVSTNWLLAYHPDAYLYGTLLQSAPYLRDDPRIQIWGGALETILSDIVDSDKMERSAAYMAVPDVMGGTP